jgi:hypothetical protein
MPAREKVLLAEMPNRFRQKKNGLNAHHLLTGGRT